MKLGPNQRAWVDALRSGAYKQGDMALQTDQTFCCLGVACDLAQKQGVKVRINLDNEIGGSTLASHPTVREWLAMTSDNGEMGGSQLPLTELNDSGTTFDVIAWVIEENPGLLFEEPR